MIRKVLAVVFAALMVAGVFASCTKEPVTSDDSSTVASAEGVSSEKEEASSSSKKESSSNKTQSVSSKKQDKDEEETETSSKKNGARPGNDEEEEEVSSETQSTSVKVYKNNDTLQLHCYHFNMGYCDSYGTDNESRIKEFTQVVEGGFFNTYVLSLNADILQQVEIIAKNGGTIWLHTPDSFGHDSQLEGYIDECKFYFDLLEKKGYLNLVNGFHWDEPAPNESFLKLTERLYKEFGLRNYPVFAVFSFSGAIGNEGEENIVDGYYKLNPAMAKYLTDVGYDAYSVDVREGATNGNLYKDWQEKLAPGIVDGKSYYTEIKKVLQKCTGHEANFWYYPTAYATSLWGGLNGLKVADEDYCIAMFEFLRDDLLKEKFAGGLGIYTYRDFHGGHTAFKCRIDVKNENGSSLCDCGNVWPRFSKLLKETRKQFDSIKRNKPNLGI